MAGCVEDFAFLGFLKHWFRGRLQPSWKLKVPGPPQRVVV